MSIQISTDDTIPYEQSLPNLLGGAPMKGLGSLYVRSWNPNTGICDFINMMKVDSADTKEYVTQMVSSMINNMDHKTDADRQKALKEVSAQFSQMYFDIRY
jgi:hypothetical protein